MFFKKHHKEDDIEINLTPMLDVVFIMLIFFIVSTSFVKESGISVNPPTSKTTTQKPEANIFIAIDAKGNIFIDNTPIMLHSIVSKISTLKQNMSEPSVVIQADGLTSTQSLVDVMDRVRQSGITKIAIGSKKE